MLTLQFTPLKAEACLLARNIKLHIFTNQLLQALEA